MDPEDPCWVRILLLFLIGRGRDESGPCAEEQSFLVDDSNRRQKNLSYSPSDLPLIRGCGGMTSVTRRSVPLLRTELVRVHWCRHNSRGAGRLTHREVDQRSEGCDSSYILESSGSESAEGLRKSLSSKPRPSEPVPAILPKDRSRGPKSSAVSESVNTSASDGKCGPP